MLQRQLHCKVLQRFNRQLLLLCAELELWLLVPSPVIERLAKSWIQLPYKQQWNQEPGNVGTNVLEGAVSWLWFYTHFPPLLLPAVAV